MAGGHGDFLTKSSKRQRRKPYFWKARSIRRYLKYETDGTFARPRADKNKIISFTGKNGGIIKKLSTINININNSNYGMVEDIHLSLMHSIAQIIRLKNLKKNNLKFKIGNYLRGHGS